MKKNDSSPRRIKSLVDRYFEECAEEDVFPDLAGMRVALGMSAEEMELAGEQDEVKRIFDTARDRRESYLVRAMTADNKRTSGCMNALKQRENGGYAEKTELTAPTLNINVIGIPGGMEAFK